MKRISGLLIVIALLLASVNPASAWGGPGVTINGQPVPFTSNSGSPFVDSANRTQVPFRLALETFGATVSWDQSSQTAIAEKDGILIEVPIGASYIYKNGSKVANDTAALVKDNRTYLPIRAVLEAFEADVKWDSTTSSVVVSTPGAENMQSYRVVRVVDGDTIVVDLNGSEEKVRLIGIDTPESVHPDSDRNVEYGLVASDFTKYWLVDKDVTLEYDVQTRDQYNRILAYAYLGGQMFNKALLAEGHAKVATYPPNVRYVDDFTLIQKQAQEKGIGVWASNAFSTSAPSTVITNESTNVKQSEASYTGNSNTHKFHKNSCSSVEDISPHNLIYFNNRADAIKGGYVPCKRCNP